MADAGSDVRDAASIILYRRGAGGPAVLMGQRGASAAFMPAKFVFPGGAVDAADADVPLATPLPAASHGRIAAQGQPPGAFAAAAIRELWEEAGLALGVPSPWPAEPPAGEWGAFADAGVLPAAGTLHFVFRAITPPGRTRRFDARFFLAEAAAIVGDPDDFSRACDELSHLQWVPLAEARRLSLPFITEIVLAEVTPLIEQGGAPERVAFFDNSGARPAFRWIA